MRCIVRQVTTNGVPEVSRNSNWGAFKWSAKEDCAGDGLKHGGEVASL